MVTERVAALGGRAVVARHWAEGGAGAADLARVVADVVDGHTGRHTEVYPDDADLWEKLRAVAQKIYGAADITAGSKVREEIERLNAAYGTFPVCIAKTQMSFSTDPAAIGAPSGHTVEISEVRLAAGARFIVAIAGNMMTMPGLPKVPAAEQIDVDAEGNIVGLF